MHSQLALTEHVSLNLAPLILLDPVDGNQPFTKKYPLVRCLAYCGVVRTSFRLFCWGKSTVLAFGLEGDEHDLNHKEGGSFVKIFLTCYWFENHKVYLW